MPEETRIGEKVSYQVEVKNTSDIVTLHDIELQQLKAKGFSIASTSLTEAMGKKNSANKDAASDGIMKIAILKPSEKRTITVKASADEEGELRSCLAIVNYKPAICLTSQVIKPELELTKMAPKQASRCDVIELEYIVKNGGSGNAIRRGLLDPRLERRRCAGQQYSNHRRDS